MTTISVLIPTHGRPVLLERTLRSLAACHLPAGYAETVVVENGSRAGAEAVVAEIAAEHPALRLRYLHVGRANKSHALNEALATIDEGLVVFFDDDVRLEPGVLEAYAVAAEGYSGGTSFGGSCRVDYEEEPKEWLKSLLPLCARGFDLQEGSREWDLYMGYNWAAYASDIRQAGGFDPNFGPGSPGGNTGQEADMQLRLLELGGAQVDVPNAVVWHYVPVERCTPGWVLKREFRGGKEAGLRARKGGTRQIVPDHVRGLLVGGGAVVKRVLLQDKIGRFVALKGLCYHAGFFKGFLR